MAVEVPDPLGDPVDALDAAMEEFVPPIDWWALPLEEQAVALLELSGFVKRLVETFALPSEVIPECWWRYEAFIVELLGLQQLYATTMLPAMPGSGMVTYAEHLALALDRLRDLVRRFGCASQFVAPRVPSWAVSVPWETATDVSLTALVCRLGGFSSSDVAELAAESRWDRG